MGDKVGLLHRQPRVAKIPQWEQGQGAAGMPQEYQRWVKRLQGWLQARQERARTATEPQKMQAVIQLPEAKVYRAAKPHLWVAQLPQPQVGILA